MAIKAEDLPKNVKRFIEWAERMDAFPDAPVEITNVMPTLDGTMVFGTVTPAAMAKLCFVSDWTITDQDSPSHDKRGYQRPIKSARIPEIGRYMVEEFQKKTLRIPPVILSVRHVDGADQKDTFIHHLRASNIEGIHERFTRRAVCIVDGQHRTGGSFDAVLRLDGEFDIAIPVVMYFDLSYETEANWFNTINSTAQPIPKSLLEWTRLDITEVTSDSLDQRVRRITERLATEPGSPFLDQVNFAGGRQMGRHITFEGLRRATADLLGGRKAKLLQRLEENHEDPYDFIETYWKGVAEACSEAWDADPKDEVRYRIKELVAIAALAKLGNTLTEQAMIQGQQGPAIRRFVLSKVTRLDAVDWRKDEDNQWMRAQAGFAGQIPLYETLRDWVLMNRAPRS